MRHQLRLCGQRILAVGVGTGIVVLGPSRYRVRPVLLNDLVFGDVKMWIMTVNGWRQIQSATAPGNPEVPFRNPFRSWQAAGAPSFSSWLGASG